MDLDSTRITEKGATSHHDISFDIEKCILCQETTEEKLVSTPTGCKRVREACDIRNDIVTKRMKVIAEESTFFYHVSNKCYKAYTHSTKLKKNLKDGSTEQSDSRLQSKTHTRAKSSVRSVSVTFSKCVVCGKKSYRNDFKKYRICESARALLLLEAAHFFQDEVFERICDLQDEYAVFGADLYYHAACFAQYIRKYERLPNPNSVSNVLQLSPKQQAWERVKAGVEEGLKEGKSFELSVIRDMLNRQSDAETTFNNRTVKVYLIRHFGEGIKFLEQKGSKSMRVYSVDSITPDTAAKQIHSSEDPIKLCANLIRDSFESHNFDLDDRFCDAEDLKQVCSAMKMPEPVLRFFGYLFNFDASSYDKVAGAVVCKDMDADDEKDDDSDEDEPEFHDTLDSDSVQQASDRRLSVKRCRNIQSLFQTMYYVHFQGKKRTPMHIMNAESAHSLGRGGKVLTNILHRQGLALSYTELRRYQHDMAAYTAQHNMKTVALPAHFDPGEFTAAAIDNWDHEGANTSEHDTVCVLFQDKPKSKLVKPKRSDTTIEHGPQRFKETLPCQKLQEFVHPVKRTNLPESFNGKEELFKSDIAIQRNISDVAWSIGRLNLEVTDTQLANIIYPEKQGMPSWSASNAVWTDEKVPLKHVAFLPVLPFPVTLYSSVYTQMKNLVEIGSQLVQTNIPVYADEKVYSMAKEIQLLRPTEFKTLVLCLGTFHTVKTLLRCTGKSLQSSGAESVWLEAGVYGPSVIQNSILNGGHYNRSLDAQKLLAESMQRLLYKEFFLENGVTPYSDVVDILKELKENTAAGNEEKSKRSLEAFNTSASKLVLELEKFKESRSSRNENFQFWCQFLERHKITLDLLRADREGLWELHLDAMQRALFEFAAWDATNYLRWGTMYLEDARNLEKSAPDVHEQFLNGHSFSIKDSPGRFTAVGGDQKLEQTINLSSKSSDCVIGHAKQKQFIAQWDMIYHEMMAVKNLHREYSGVKEITSEAINHHESSELFTKRKEKHIQAMMKYIEKRGSPFSVESPTQLHNFVTKEVMTDEIKTDLLQSTQKGKEKYKEFHTERFLKKTTQLRDTIHRSNLKTMAKVNEKPKKTTKTVKQTMSLTQKSIEVARDRGLSSEELLSYDIVQSPVLFDEEGLMTKPDKSSLIRELEAHLKKEEYNYTNEPNTAYLVDVMASLRKMHISDMKTFSDLVSKIIDMNILYQHGRCDFVFDMYTDSPSVKDSERQRRAKSTPVVLSTIDGKTPLPKDMSTFWPSSQNKFQLEKLVYDSLVEHCLRVNSKYTVLSQLSQEADWSSVMIQDRKVTSIPSLKSDIEEADLRFPMHVLDCVRTGHKKCTVLSNDTDVIVALIHHFAVFAQEGLEQLWVKAGVANSTRFIPIHILHQRLMPNLPKVLPALHSLTGSDITSKVGTKKAALKAEPVKHLQGFGAFSKMNDTVSHEAEKYLVNVLDNGSKAKNFNELRVHIFHHTKSSSLQNLPPTSQGLAPHIERAHFNAYTMMHVLDKQLGIQTSVLDPLNSGFIIDNGSLLPLTTWRLLEYSWNVVCHCGKCARISCPCRREKVKCSKFCKCKIMNQCQNKNK